MSMTQQDTHGLTTTLREIRDHSPCADGWDKLLRHLGKNVADTEPLPYRTILESNGIADAVWCLRCVEQEERWRVTLFAAQCAESVLPIANDKRCDNAVEVVRRYAFGLASEDEINQAIDAARAAAIDAARAAAIDAARDAAWDAAWAAWDAACAARDAARDARDAARDAARAARAAARAAWAAARDAARDAARAAARDAARDAEKEKQRVWYLAYICNPMPKAHYINRLKHEEEVR